MSTSSPPSSSATLLIEVFTEELPPKSLRKLGDAFAASLSASIQAAGLSTAESVTTSFASPRRLAVQITHVLSKAADFPVREKVLPVSVAFDANGKPTPPLLKKLSALGYPDIDIASLERSGQDKNEALYLNVQARGAVLQDTVQTAIVHALQTLPIAKMMHYQVKQVDGTLEDVQFARPAHRIVALHGSTPLQVHALGINAANQTEGHRFLAPSVLTIGNADQYAAELLKNKVMANFNERRAYIEAELLKAANGDTVLMPSNLLDEVTALVEWPTVYACHFDAEFLEVPQECLILTMQTNQKYFALTDAAGKLRNRFLIVSNIETATPQSIIQGNERVVRPRLSDARFFFQQDQKRPLSSRVADLGKVVYHNQLGTQLERTKRVGAIATAIATDLQSKGSAVNPKYVARAAELAKTDLLTDMVGEFPELQGIMGSYYAAHDGEDAEVAAACSEHYQPRFAGDALPSSMTGTVLAIADKLETLVGIWGVGLAHLPVIKTPTLYVAMHWVFADCYSKRIYPAACLSSSSWLVRNLSRLASKKKLIQLQSMSLLLIVCVLIYGIKPKPVSHLLQLRSMRYSVKSLNSSMT